MTRLVYSPRYNIGFYGLERFHPFDSRKYGRAWKQIVAQLGPEAGKARVRTDRQAHRAELQLVHSPEYLMRLKDRNYVARALEVPQLGRLPSWAIDWHVLRPMRWATRGSILAARYALEDGLAINLGGGFHHAKPDRGEGFSIYNDIAIAVADLRQSERISDSARIVYVDTDVHQGNGVCHSFLGDARAFLFDIFHSGLYPVHDSVAQQRIDCPLRITSTITDREYLAVLKDRLPGFLDSVNRAPVGLAIYNAGTDIVEGDPLGQLSLKPETVIERDRFVIQELRNREIPTMMVLSGGYTAKSYQIIADSVVTLFRQMQ